MLEQFPVPLICIGDGNIQKIYLEERNQIKDVESLKAHISKWKVVWEWGAGTKEEEELVSGQYNPEEVYECFKQHSPTTSCGHQTPSCHAMHVYVPVLFIWALLLSEKYGVCFDLALFRVLESKGAITDRDRSEFFG